MTLVLPSCGANTGLFCCDSRLWASVLCGTVGVTIGMVL